MSQAVGLQRFGMHLSAVNPDGLIHNGETQAGAAQLPAAPFVGPVKTLVQMGQAFLRDTGAVVGKDKMPPPAFLPRRQGDGAPRPGLT